MKIEISKDKRGHINKYDENKLFVSQEEKSVYVTKDIIESESVKSELLKIIAEMEDKGYVLSGATCIEFVKRDTSKENVIDVDLMFVTINRHLEFT